ncbi:MAG: zinc ribbon domain-containing protein [Bacilli bacterium]
MICSKCKTENIEGNKFCTTCGTPLIISTPNNQNNNGGNTSLSDMATGNNQKFKASKILSYIGIFWIIGLLTKDKDASLKFHVGQGMILFIAQIVLTIIVSVLSTYVISKIFVSKTLLFGYPTGVFTVSSIGTVLIWILDMCEIAFGITYMIIGIKNATKDIDKELPIIGKFAFYE